MQKILYFIFVISVGISGCATTPPPPKDYTAFNTENINSILVIPVVNKSVDVTAPEYFLSTVSIPIAEHGYYVFPVNLVKRILEDDGLSDANLVHGASATRLASLFGADAVLYMTIDRWDAEYSIISTTITVGITYVLKSGKSGETLWEDTQTKRHQPQSSGSAHPAGLLLEMLITAAIAKADPNYMPLAKQVNAIAFKYPGPGFPHGPYFKAPKKNN